MVAELNARYLHSRLGSTLHDAGVLLHTFDQLEDWNNHNRAYRPCHSGWCNGQFDHESCTLVNLRLPHIYNNAGGIILSARVGIECGFAADGGTQGRTMAQICGQQRCTPSRWWQCCFGPGEFSAMLEAQQHTNSAGYNEVIVSNAKWDALLPDSVEAILDGGRAREVHERFLLDFPSKVGVVPLVRYTVGVGFSQV